MRENPKPPRSITTAHIYFDVFKDSAPLQLSPAQ